MFFCGIIKKDFFILKTDTKLIPGVTDMLKAAPFLHFFDGISIQILSPRFFILLLRIVYLNTNIGCDLGTDICQITLYKMG